jgi:hypothetical protein
MTVEFCRDIAMSASLLYSPTPTLPKHRCSDLIDFLFKLFRLKCFPNSFWLLIDNAVCGILRTYKRSPVDFNERDRSKWLLQTVQYEGESVNRSQMEVKQL